MVKYISGTTVGIDFFGIVINDAYYEHVKYQTRKKYSCCVVKGTEELRRVKN